MVWAYVMENGDGVEKHSNQPVFQLIQKMGLTDEQLVFDQDDNRGEFCKLLESLQTGDKLIIRSVEDLADDLMDLICIFQKLTDKQISLCSVEEPFLSGEDYLGSITEFTRLYVLFQKKKQQAGYRKACISAMQEQTRVTRLRTLAAELAEVRTSDRARELLGQAGEILSEKNRTHVVTMEQAVTQFYTEQGEKRRFISWGFDKLDG